jgi:hypothetical protein
LIAQADLKLVILLLILFTLLITCVCYQQLKQYKNLCKCHNVPPLSATIKEKNVNSKIKQNKNNYLKKKDVASIFIYI